jgi:uncharacterized membrane-anchored protein YhcB (DUF1043 family)
MITGKYTWKDGVALVVGIAIGGIIAYIWL